MSEANKNVEEIKNNEINNGKEDDRIYFKDDTNVTKLSDEKEKEVDVVNRQVIDAPDNETYTRDSNDQPVLVFN